MIKWFLILLTIVSSYAQVPFRIPLKVARIPINHSGPQEIDTVRVLLVFVGPLDNPKELGIVTPKDTLILRNLLFDHHVYIDKSSQKYLVEQYGAWGRGMMIFISPIKPYRRKLWSLVLSSY